jgi:flagellar biosynthesis anti-sigma factor FlgM
MDVRDLSTYTPGLANTDVQQASRVRTDGSPSDPTTGPTKMGSDSSDLSRTSRALAQAMQFPEVRQDRVASLQQQIAAGTYQVDPQDVADAILRDLAG